MPKYDMADVIQDAASKIWQRMAEDGTRTTFSRLDPLGRKSPSSLVPIFRTVLHRVSVDALRESYRRTPWSDQSLGLTTEDGGDPMDELPSSDDYGVSDVNFRVLIRAFKTWVLPRIKDQELKDVFMQFIEVFSREKDFEGINWRRDVWEPVKKRKYGDSDELPYHSTKQRWNKVVRPLVIQFLERQGFELSSGQKRKLKMSSIDAVALVTHVEQIKRWVLGKHHEELKRVMASVKWMTPVAMAQKIDTEKEL